MADQAVKGSMPTSVTGTSSRLNSRHSVAMMPANRGAGFSLIEILVVIVIIGIVLSIAIMSVSLIGGDKTIREEARRVMALVEVARDESMLQGREYGIEFMIGGYRFVELDPLTGQWNEVIGDDTLRMRDLPEELEVRLYLEDRPVILKPNPADTELKEGILSSRVERYSPHVLIYSSGDMTPFEAQFVRSVDDTQVAIRSDLTGLLEFVDPEAAL